MDQSSKPPDGGPRHWGARPIRAWTALLGQPVQVRAPGGICIQATVLSADVTGRLVLQATAPDAAPAHETKTE